MDASFNTAKDSRHLIVLDALYLTGLAAFLALLNARHFAWRFTVSASAVIVFCAVRELLVRYVSRYVRPEQSAPVLGDRLYSLYKDLGSEYLSVSCFSAMAITFIPDYLPSISVTVASAASACLILASLVFWHWRVRRHLSLIPPDAAVLS
jgi:hypothetical protein